jgi:hypothetical protein
MDPERQIEKQLRAYAKKRRQDAGAEPGLHPTTRRLLQAEVARRAPKPDRPGRLAGILTALRPRLAVALCFIALAVAGFFVWRPGWRATRGEAPATLAMERREATVAAAPESAPTSPRNEPRPATTAVAESIDQARRDKAAAANETIPAEEASTTPTRGRTAAAPKTSGAIAGRQELAKDERELAMSESAAPSVGTASPAAGVVPAPELKTSVPATSLGGPRPWRGEETGALAMADTVGGNVPASAAEPQGQTRSVAMNRNASPQPSSYASVANTQRYVQSQPGEETLDTAKAMRGSVAGPAGVLTSFELEQDGPNIRIVDRDGSVYRGTVQWTNPVAAADAGVATNTTSMQAVSRGPAQNYLLNCRGVNRSLNQTVTFTGNLIATGETQNNQRAIESGEVAGKFKSAGAGLQPLPLANSRISGTAVIDNTRRIQVDAISAPPQR